MKKTKMTAGFTLVELIVVIAILGILAGVGTVGYSGYIKKANKQADISLASEVANALNLYYYSHPGEFTKGYVVLNQEGTAATADAIGAAAMVAVYGENWQNIVELKYDGWNGGNYSNSSFSGNETVMTGKVEVLTDLLGNTIADTPTLVGTYFTDYMTNELGFSATDLEDTAKVADAAVLYVANGTSKLTPDQQKEFQQIAVDASQNDDVFASMLMGYSSLYGSDVMGAAATYAMLTAYCQYEDEKAGNTNMMDALGTPDVSGVTTGSLQELGNMIGNSVSRLDSILEAGNGLNYEEYWSEVAPNDAAAFVDVMRTVNDAKGQIVGNLGTANCFTSQELQNLFTQFGAGAITVLAELQADGKIVVTTVPKID